MTSLLKRTRYGFTIIELLIVISIIATLSIVVYASTQAIQTSRYNTKRIADVASLSNALEAQYLQTKTIPDPTANRQYYDNHGSYTHSASGAYGVTSLFSEDLLSKSNLAYHPRDPDTDSYYAYGKLLQYSPEYQVGAVLKIDGTPTAYIRGTYSRTELDSLIRGYNTTIFATDGGTSSLPYNPYKKEVTAYIVESSGAIAINPTKELTSPMIVGDTLTVGTGGIAILKVSDGTELIIGSNTNESRFTFSSMELKDDTGLLTKVRGILAMGEVVAKAPKLRTVTGNRSDLEIETGNAVAAVRWTIFGVKAAQASDPNATFTLIAGTIQIGVVKQDSNITLIGSGVTTDTVSVPEWQNPVKIQIIGVNNTTEKAYSQAITDPADATVASIIQKVDNASAIESILVTPTEISFDPIAAGTATSSTEISNSGTVVLENIPGTDTIEINDIPYSITPTNTGSTVHFPTSRTGDYHFKYCKRKIGKLICSKAFKISIPDPHSGIVPLDSFAPVTKNNTMQVAANVGVVDSLEVAAPDVFTPTPAITTSSGMISTTSITTIASGSTTSITTTPTNCSNLGTTVGMSTMIGCADYTKGTINLTVSGTSNYLYSVIKWMHNVFNSRGLYLANTTYSYLKYLKNWNSLEHDYELEFWVEGINLVAPTNSTTIGGVPPKYYLFDGGDKLQLWKENNVLTVRSNTLFNWATGNTQTIVSWPLTIDSTKNYTVKLSVENGRNVNLKLKNNTTWTWDVIATGVTGNDIEIQNFSVGSSNNDSSYPSYWNIGQWGGNIQFFRIWKS